MCSWLEIISFRFHGLEKMKVVGIENAVKWCKIHDNRWRTMLGDRRNTVLIAEEACNYLRISRPTYFKYLGTGKIKGIKAGKGW